MIIQPLYPFDESQDRLLGVERRIGAEPDEIRPRHRQRPIPGPAGGTILDRLLPGRVAAEAIRLRVIEVDVVAVALDLVGDGPERVVGRLAAGDGGLVQRRLQHCDLTLVGQHQLVDQGCFEGGEHVTVAGHRLVDAAQIAGHRQGEGDHQHQGPQQEGKRGQQIITPTNQPLDHQHSATKTGMREFYGAQTELFID